MKKSEIRIGSEYAVGSAKLNRAHRAIVLEFGWLALRNAPGPLSLPGHRNHPTGNHTLVLLSVQTANGDPLQAPVLTADEYVDWVRRAGEWYGSLSLADKNRVYRREITFPGYPVPTGWRVALVRNSEILAPWDEWKVLHALKEEELAKGSAQRDEKRRRLEAESDELTALIRQLGLTSAAAYADTERVRIMIGAREFRALLNEVAEARAER